MRPSDLLDLKDFIAELERETDRGLPLVSAALIDELLRDTLRSFFCEAETTEKLLDGANAPLGTFSARTQTCYSLGLIDTDELHEIGIIRKVRNAFAHAKHGMSFQDARVAGLCSGLHSDLPLGEGYPVNQPRFRFVNSVIAVTLRLYYRPEWVALERRQPKVWVAAEAVRWRSVKEERPPSGIPLIVLKPGDDGGRE